VISLKIPLRIGSFLLFFFAGGTALMLSGHLNKPSIKSRPNLANLTKPLNPIASATKTVGLTPGLGSKLILDSTQIANPNSTSGTTQITKLFDSNGFPLLLPSLPDDAEVWNCEVAVIGGSLGGVAAAYHAMQTGATTCLIELTPMLGGQVSSQGVSAIDESFLMRRDQIFTASWNHFKNKIAAQPALTAMMAKKLKSNPLVADVNSCWVGNLCFTPTAGNGASQSLLQEAIALAPGSRWQTNVAFKGAEINSKGNLINAIYAVRRQAKQPNYIPLGRLSLEIGNWYAWASDRDWYKKAIKIQAPPGKRLIVIDATDTAELIGWADLPHRIGAESFATTGEKHAVANNTECTQAFTFPFILQLADDKGKSLKRLRRLRPGYSRAEHRQFFQLGRYPMFSGNSLFNYRRIFSALRDDAFFATPVIGDMTAINWNNGNDWGVMNPSLIMTYEQINKSGQRHNWLGGLNLKALKDGENHSLLFSEWLIEKYATKLMPLTHLAGAGTPLQTESGLSIYPYIREGRRILGREAYDQKEFFVREQDIRVDMEGRDFRNSKIGVTHYAIDMHGCRYRNWEPSKSPSSAPVSEEYVRPILLPLESLIPQKIDNLLIGSKGIAVSSIVNGATRIHVGEWAVGSASGAIAGWISKKYPEITPQGILTNGKIKDLQEYLLEQGIKFDL
jgi:FAD dependent oxidoreductase